MKVVAEVELTTGLLTGLEALPGRSNEKAAGLAHAPLPAGALLLEDMGFLAAARLQEYVDQGVYVLTRVPAWSAVFAPGGGWIDLPSALEGAGGWYAELAVELFHRRVPMRLLAARLPDEQAARQRGKVLADARKRGRAASRERLALCGWNVLLTNAPAGALSVREAWDVRRAWWQEELLFKEMKSGDGGLGRSRSSKPWRVGCEVYARLLGAVARSWVLLAAGYAVARDSVLKASRSARRWAGAVLSALGRPGRLRRVVARIAEHLRRRGRTQRRRKTPSTYDRLAAHDRHFDQAETLPPPLT